MKGKIRSYDQALDYIYSYIDFSLTRNLRYSEDKFDLSRMGHLMNLLGDPQHKYDIVHVAGTKGKGSTCAMVASILKEQGFKVGLYTSPHMIDFTERIQVNQQEISQHEIIQLVNAMRGQIEAVNDISTFEITTALAFQHFFEKQVDIAVIEVGMGGRLDATNVVNPVITAITSISLDHTKILGNTVKEIAKEKAGILKRQIPVVIAKQPDHAAKETIAQIADGLECRIIDVEKKFLWDQISHSLFGQEFTITTNEGGFNKTSNPYRLKLLGDHQLDNAATAYAIVKNLPLSKPVSDQAIAGGYEKVRWPGRFEVVYEGPLIIIDGAHNPFSFEKLAETIRKYLTDKKITLIFGASEDKDVGKMIEIITPNIDEIIFTKSDHPRALTQEEFVAILASNGKREIKYMELEEILDEIFNDKNKVYVAAGSIFIAGAVKELLKNKGIG